MKTIGLGIIVTSAAFLITALALGQGTERTTGSAWQITPISPELKSKAGVNPKFRQERLAQVESNRLVPDSPKSQPAAAARSPVAGSGGKWIDAPAGARRALSVKERHELGLTIHNLANVYKQLASARSINSESSEATVAAAILVNLEKQSTFTDKTDLDAVLEFVETLVPLIERLLK